MALVEPALETERSSRVARHLRRALRLAARGRFGAPPNPMVGPSWCATARWWARGGTGSVGGAHAEVEAIRAAGERARGATLYVTLEPCAHHGRTPPCADAVIAAGIARVVACHRDPDPRVTGKGFHRLREAGSRGRRRPRARGGGAPQLALPRLQARQRPAVTLKWAMSLDGRIATATGESQWISGPAGRRWALDLREEHAAILVGSGTVLADDPLLTRRLGKAPGLITRIVLDRRLRTPPTARLLGEPGRCSCTLRRLPSGERRWAKRPGDGGRRCRSVSPQAVLEDLHRREIQSLLVEGGGACSPPSRRLGRSTASRSAARRC